MKKALSCQIAHVLSPREKVDKGEDKIEKDCDAFRSRNRQLSDARTATELALVRKGQIMNGKIGGVVEVIEGKFVFLNNGRKDMGNALKRD